MVRHLMITVIIGLLVLAVGCDRRRATMPVVTLSSSLQKLTNLNTFAETPSGSMQMVSTYDRSGGNNDWGQWDQRSPDGTADLVTLEGPGCLTRIWGTSIPASEWLFYVDGEVTPRIRRSKAEIFGGALPFLPPLSDIVSGGRYSYVPIPFADSLRIAVAVPPHNPSMRPYYHVNYASYPPGTHVESLPVDMSTEEVMLIEDVNAVWERKDGALSAAAATCGELSMVSLAAGEVHEWFDLEGPGLLSAIVVKIAPR